MTRTVWTQNESRLVAKKYLDLLDQGFQKRSAILEAQRVLPPERRKTEIAAMALVYDKSRTGNDFSFYIKNPHLIASPPDETTSVSGFFLAPERTEPDGEATPIAAPTSSNLESALQSLAEQFSSELVERVRSALLPKIDELESEIMGRLIESGALVATASLDKIVAARLPRVLIVSLRGQQGPEIRKEFEGLLRVQWVESGTHDSAIAALRNFPGNVICMAKFISHSDEGHFKNHPRHRTLHGGMTELREALLEIAAKEEVDG